MPTFAFLDGPYKYRPLKKKNPLMRGWDVLALQTGLMSVGQTLPKHGADGYLGNETATAIWRLQQSTNELADDGIAGIQTQRYICLLRIDIETRNYGIYPGLLYGQVEKECGFQVGNYTAEYTSGDHVGTRDCGVTQHNTKYTSAEKGFDTGWAIKDLAEQVKKKYLEYRGLGNGLSDRRCWELAAGSWNAPSWTDRLARGQYVYPSNVNHIEAYIDRVTTYCIW